MNKRESKINMTASNIRDIFYEAGGTNEIKTQIGYYISNIICTLEEPDFAIEVFKKLENKKVTNQLILNIKVNYGY